MFKSDENCTINHTPHIYTPSHHPFLDPFFSASSDNDGTSIPHPTAKNYHDKYRLHRSHE